MDNLFVADSTIASGSAPYIYTTAAETLTFDYNTWYFPNDACDKIGGVGGSITEGPSVTTQDPTFVDYSGGNYRLTRFSPLLDVGSAGNNIGWDQLTKAWVTRNKAQVTAVPVKSTAGDNLLDEDNGGGFDTTNINDYPSSFLNRKPAGSIPNSYRAPNLR